MLKVAGCIIDEHDLSLVVVAGLICMLASHTAFSLLHRATKQQARQRYQWLTAAAVSMGGGVWATHFIAMVAYRTPLLTGYDLPLTVLSAALAIGFSGVALWLVLSGLRVLGGAVAGAMIAAMHYTGMSASEGWFTIEWDLDYVAASIVIGIALSALAFYLLPRAEGLRGRALVVTLFVLAICGLHFTGMTGATLEFDPLAMPENGSGLERQSLAVAVAAVAALLLGIGAVSAILDTYLADRNAQEAERLRRYISELEATKHELQATTDNLRVALEAAATSSQAKSQFLATMSHELRTPLNAIIGFSELLTNESLGPIGNRRYIEYATDIHDSGRHLLSLINDVLDFSKAEAGRLELHEESLDAGEVLRDCLRLVEPEAREAGIAVQADLPAASPALKADRRRLKQIALNLLSNALKFTPPGGELSVSLTFAGDGAAIKFSDTGVGMTAAQIPVAMEAFGQIDSSLSRKYEGTGLGLPLCRHMVEAHGGSLSIESVLGQGTTVTVRFPAERVLLTQAA
ncbi:MAG: MHYT domain-containing protein [Kiloniellaceae bacterium]